MCQEIWAVASLRSGVVFHLQHSVASQQQQEPRQNIHVRQTLISICAAVELI